MIETDNLIIQPDLSYQISLYDERYNTFKGNYTISDIISLLNQKTPCDSVFIGKGIHISQGYSIMTPLNIGQRSKYYVGDNLLYGPDQNRQYILWQYLHNIFPNDEPVYYNYYGDSDLTKDTASYNIRTINGIDYYSDYFPRNNTYKPILYITSNVQELVVNDAWQSVSSIIGKGITYNLSQLLNINGGIAVNNVPASGNVTLVNDSRLDTLIENVLQNESEVVVDYTIPSGTYSYIKLVYKKDGIPTSYTDGTAIDITQASTEKIIQGIADGDTYWFVIFTNVSESEPVKFVTTYVEPEE